MKEIEEEKFSLKDALFNAEKVAYLSDLVHNAYYNFDENAFRHDVMAKFPKLELKERIYWIGDCLEKYLPKNYEALLHILVQTLPEELDPENTDDDFGDFIFSPLAYLVAKKGQNSRDLPASLEALGEMTKRFSVEYSIRYFLNSFPKETFAKMMEWSQSENYHQRRLASEGLRPTLPWGIGLDDYKIENSAKILDNLYADKARFVTRSVANHLNDISKFDPEFVLKTLKKWKKSEKQEKEEMDFLIRHSLRTLVKKGDRASLDFLGFKENPEIKILDFKIKRTKIKIGEKLIFSFRLQSESEVPENLMIDYIIRYANARNKLSEKVFKIKQLELRAGGHKIIEKKHLLKKMSTRNLYTGKHTVYLQINGKIMAKEEFHLKV